jgi:soluble lytic murein transglycosylase-like protein
MDTTTAAIILIFVISVFSGFGHNNGYKPPSPPPSAPAAPLPTTGIIDTEVSVAVPPSNYAAVEPVSAQNAIISYIRKYRSPDLAVSIGTSIMKHSAAYNVNPKLVAALIARESKFNPRALSSSGAMGLGQLLPSTARGLGVTDGFDVDQNAMGTTRYLKSLIDRFRGSVSAGLAGYLVGPNAVARDGTISGHTRSYVEDVLRIYNKI